MQDVESAYTTVETPLTQHVRKRMLVNVCTAVPVEIDVVVLLLLSLLLSTCVGFCRLFSASVGSCYRRRRRLRYCFSCSRSIFVSCVCYCRCSCCSWEIIEDLTKIVGRQCHVSADVCHSYRDSIPTSTYPTLRSLHSGTWGSSQLISPVLRQQRQLGLCELCATLLHGCCPRI